MKINVVGTSGSGKSTFSKALAAKLNIHHIELDRLFWKPNWQESSDEEFFQKIEEALQTTGWVLDGNYTRTIPVKWKNVDQVIWIDLPFWQTFSQSLKRAIARILSRKEFWPGTGNIETFRKTFMSKSSILLWVINSYDRTKKNYEEKMANSEYSHIKFVRLRSRKSMREYLEALPQVFD